MYLWVGRITVQCLRAIRQVGKAANVVATFPSLDQKPEEHVGCTSKLNWGVYVHVCVYCVHDRIMSKQLHIIYYVIAVIT